MRYTQTETQELIAQGRGDVPFVVSSCLLKSQRGCALMNFFRELGLKMNNGTYKQLRNGSKATVSAGTRVPLSATKKLVYGLRITARHDNSGLIYLGDSSVSAFNGYQLAAGVTAPLESMAGSDAVFDLAKLYIDSAVNGDGVSFAYIEEVAI